MERDLQRIRSLRDRAAGKEGQLAEHREEIALLHEAMRVTHRKLASSAWGRVPAKDALDRQAAQERDLRGEVRRLEAEVDQVHDDIAARMDKLAPSDLSYL